MSKFYDNIGEAISVIAGPCVYENYDHAWNIASQLKEITDRLQMNFIYKTSFDKANRTSIDSYRGRQFNLTMADFISLKKELNIEVLTDVHESWQCSEVTADILQIPAFLCRQTNLLESAAITGKPVNVKKGQFLSPHEMKNVVDKLTEFGCDKIMLTERGTSFGYNNLVVDFRSIPKMKELGWPIVMDCTHSVQSPGGMGTSSGGDRKMAPYMARAGVSVGADIVFMEVHNDPDNAPSDGANMIKLENVEKILNEVQDLRNLYNIFNKQSLLN